MGTDRQSWEEYYAATKSLPPRDLLLQALNLLDARGEAIDIGAGALRDTRHLLAAGFEVTAIDQDSHLAEAAAALPSGKIHAYVTSFADFDFPAGRYDLASAMYALPFNPAESFDRVFGKIKSSLKPDGIFCGQFFGLKDEWADARGRMSFHSKEQVEQLLSDLTALYFSEEEYDGTVASGAPKHWHVFNVIARKPA